MTISWKRMLLAVGLGLILWACQNIPTEAQSAYDRLMMETDSLEKIHSRLVLMHDTLATENDRLLGEIKQLDTLADTLVLERLAKYSVLIATHEVTLTKQTQIMELYQKMLGEQEKEKMTEAEITAQVSEMRNSYDEIANEHNEIQQDQEKIRAEHALVIDQLKAAALTRDSLAGPVKST